MPAVPQLVDSLRARIREVPTARRLGRVTGVTGLIIESERPLNAVNAQRHRRNTILRPPWIM